MTELDELTFGKSHEELNMELLFQLEQGETLGGTICSHIVHQIELSAPLGEEGDCDEIAERAIEAKNDEWASHQTSIDEAGYSCFI